MRHRAGGRSRWVVVGLVVVVVGLVVAVGVLVWALVSVVAARDDVWLCRQTSPAVVSCGWQR